MIRVREVKVKVEEKDKLNNELLDFQTKTQNSTP